MDLNGATWVALPASNVLPEPIVCFSSDVMREQVVAGVRECQQMANKFRQQYPEIIANKRSANNNPRATVAREQYIFGMANEAQGCPDVSTTVTAMTGTWSRIEVPSSMRHLVGCTW